MHAMAKITLVLSLWFYLSSIPCIPAIIHGDHTPISQLWRWQLFQIPESDPDFNFDRSNWPPPSSLDNIGKYPPGWKERDAAFESQGLFCHGRWLGVQVLQAPEDLMYLQQIITKLRPGIIIESGTYRGGLAFFAASIFSQLGLLQSRVITMDVFDVDGNFNNFDNVPLCPVCLDCTKAFETELWKRHVISFQGNSLQLQPTVVSMISQLRREGAVGPVLVTLDAQHSFDATMAELHLYAGLADVGSYVVLQDARLDVTYGRPGPLTAGLNLLGDVQQWAWDREVEVFGHTQHLWLRRIAEGPPVELHFQANDEDLISQTPWSPLAEGSICVGTPLREVRWTVVLGECQAVCMREKAGCWFISFAIAKAEEPPLCLLHKNCPELRAARGTTVYKLSTAWQR